MVAQIGASEPVRFELSGKEYRLRFTLGALKALSQEHKIEVMKGGPDMVDAIRDPAKLALILYHGLLTHHPEITPGWVEENFDSGMFADMVPLVATAISGRPVPNVERPGSSKANGVGLLSGPSDDTTSDSQSETSGI
jgi:hypothetical protein